MNLERITIVLYQLHYPENIGAAARAAMNMGIQKLCIVQPYNWNLARALKLATHVAAPLITNRVSYDSLEEVLKPFNFVIGTTARTGRSRPVTMDPYTMAHQISELPLSNRVALLFGPEDRGLSNKELKYCHEVVSIPTAGFHSLNVAQAVLILAYECFRTHHRCDPKRNPAEPLASSEDLERMYGRLEQTLCQIDFIDASNPDYWMRKLRRTMSKFPLTRQHVRIILGLCRQINTYVQRTRRDA